ncbi:MAG: FkbM family methyltransferase [Bacteroidales bacterium]
MKFIKKALYFIFNERAYFSIISKLFFILYFSGLLRSSKKFRMHYFVTALINRGDTIIDIGANLGYYTRIFARACGPGGNVYAVEPVPLYRRILKKNTSGLDQVKILPYALGDRESVEEMGIPGDQPYRHGLTRIIGKDEDKEKASFSVQVKTPEALFSGLDQLDYIKCDIEGYENRVIPGFAEIIRRDRPIIQIELSEENREAVNKFLTGEGYRSYIPAKKGLAAVSPYKNYNSDIIYIHNNKRNMVSNFNTNYKV